MPRADTTRFRKTPYAPALVRSTARARSPPRKGRSRQVKQLVSRRARAVASALSGVQSAEWREQGHKRTPRDPQERSFARGQTRIAHHQNRFWQFGADADGALIAYPAPRLGQYSSKHCETTPRPSLRAWRSETATHLHPLLPPTASTVAANAAAAIPPTNCAASGPSLRRQKTKPQHPEPSAAQAARGVDHGQERKGSGQ